MKRFYRDYISLPIIRIYSSEEIYLTQLLDCLSQNITKHLSARDILQQAYVLIKIRKPKIIRIHPWAGAACEPYSSYLSYLFSFKIAMVARDYDTACCELENIVHDQDILLPGVWYNVLDIFMEADDFHA